MNRTAIGFSALTVAVIAAALLAHSVIPAGHAGPANDPSARRLYLRSLSRAIEQRRLTVRTVTSETTQGDLGGRFRTTVTTRIRSVPGMGVAVMDRRRGGLPGSPISIVLAHRTLCLRNAPGGWGCAPAHPVSKIWYVRQYLLGGRVRDVRYRTAHENATTGTAVTVRFSGRGLLGCTPAGAGAGTRRGYRWCSFKMLDETQQHSPVTGRLVIDGVTRLPAGLIARGVGPAGPVIERVSFHYGGRFRVALPARARHVRCLSWVPAIHCVELPQGR